MSGSVRRPPWKSFRDALDDAGFHPSRRLGQNFLLDDNMARAIAADAGIEPGRFVLEIGPGCGFLSVHLVAAGARLLAVEIDGRLAPIARRFLDDLIGSASGTLHAAEVLERDVLAGKNALDPVVVSRLPESEPWTLASNLPYSISGPVLALIAALDHPPDRVVCLVQKEVAERLAAEPGGRDWGPLSTSFRETFEVRLGRSVPPQLFWPRPKVDSAVFVATVRSDLASGTARRSRIAFYRSLLGKRRKSLRRVLVNLAGRDEADAAIASLGLAAERRAETLTLDELRAVHAEVADASE